MIMPARFNDEYDHYDPRETEELLFDSGPGVAAARAVGRRDDL